MWSSGANPTSPTILGIDMKSKADKITGKIEAGTIPLNQETIQTTVKAYNSQIEELNKKVQFLQSKLWKYRKGEKAIFVDNYRGVEIVDLLEDDPYYLYRVKYTNSEVEFRCSNDDLIPMPWHDEYIKLLISKIQELKDENKKLKKQLGL